MYLVIICVCVIVSIVAHALSKSDKIKKVKVKDSLFFAGMAASMIAGGVTVFLIDSHDSANAGAYAHFVNGVKVSEGSAIGMEMFVVWMLISAVINLISMGIGKAIGRR